MPDGARSANYNLLEEPWVPVLWKNGNTSRIGITQALTEAHRIRQIAASNPAEIDNKGTCYGTLWL